ncbi:hypothetical protein CN327_26960 [Bacillus cereus]|nr:hypothetical protein CN509_29230 [Bacillus cereus]PES94524.1 hypothetical protein CN505_31105 [Bacillus cereus]PFF28709.1 hypothetical protein CN327_26960 [Bacillus cereus]PFI43529.1 hypothetical protein COI73_28500 [Bacillus cereus]
MLDFENFTHRILYYYKKFSNTGILTDLVIFILTINNNFVYLRGIEHIKLKDKQEWILRY